MLRPHFWREFFKWLKTSKNKIKKADAVEINPSQCWQCWKTTLRNLIETTKTCLTLTFSWSHVTYSWPLLPFFSFSGLRPALWLADKCWLTGRANRFLTDQWNPVFSNPKLFGRGAWSVYFAKGDLCTFSIGWPRLTENLPRGKLKGNSKILISTIPNLTAKDIISSAESK